MVEIVEFSRSKKTYPDVIAILEELLVEAKAGQIESMCYVTRSPDGGIFYRQSDTENLTGLLGGVTYLQHEMLHNVQEN